MKRRLRPPRYLPEVLQAIGKLKETGGSNSNKIVSYVRAATDTSNPYLKPRNLSIQVRRALTHAVSNGIVKQRAGKFRLNSKVVGPFKDCAECRRRRRARFEKRRRRRRGRKHANVPAVDRALGLESDRDRRLAPKRRRRGTKSTLAVDIDSTFSVDSELDREHRCRLDSDSESDLPLRQLRSRRRRRGGEKKRRRRRRRRGHKDALSAKPSSHKTDANKNIEEDLKKDVVYPDDHNPEEGPLNEDGQCDNPDCLCNVKEEHEENKNFDDSII